MPTEQERYSIVRSGTGVWVMHAGEELLEIPEPFGSRVLRCVAANDDTFNCHGAAEYILNGRTPVPHQISKRSLVPVRTRQSAHAFNLPCGFQMRGSPVGNDPPIHSGVLLGAHPSHAEVHLVCHKVGWGGPLEISTLHHAEREIHISEDAEAETLKTVFYGREQ